MYVSTPASYLQAVGADLEIRAVLPDGRAVKVTQFAQYHDAHSEPVQGLETGWKLEFEGSPCVIVLRVTTF